LRQNLSLCEKLNSFLQDLFEFTIFEVQLQEKMLEKTSLLFKKAKLTLKFTLNTMKFKSMQGKTAGARN
jgi:hypothetical protein